MRKTTTKLLAIVLAVVMLFGAAPLSGFKGVGSSLWNGLCSLAVSAKEGVEGFIETLTPVNVPDNSAGQLAATGQCGDNVYWSFDSSTGALTISGTGDMRDYDWYYNNSPFEYDSLIKSIIIEHGVTSIGHYAFYDCSSLTSIEIPDSVTSIGAAAFHKCGKLANVTIGNSVTSIGEGAFAWCGGLTSVTIGNSVSSIGNKAFEDCSGLTSVTIGNSVSSIGNCAFEDCRGLTRIDIPDSVTSIGDGAFENCSSLTSVTIGNSVTSIGNGAFKYCSSLTSIEIPDSVTSIGVNAFYGTAYYKNLSNWENDVLYIGNHLIEAKDTISGSYVIKDGTKFVDDYAFSHCNSLTSIVIPDSVTSIGDCAFTWWCSSLTSITVDNNNNNYSSDSFGVLYNKDKTELIQYPIGNERTSFTIPDSVTSIGNHAFLNCSSLTSVTIPDSVTSIGNRTFEDCSSLTSVTIGNSVTSIGVSAFYGCTGLTSISIPDSVTSIGSSAFYGCTGLTSISIPDSVTSIGNSAFYGCSKLKDVYYSGSQGQWKNISIGSFNYSLTSATIHYNSTGSGDSGNEQGEVHAILFDPNSSSNIYQANGKIENYTIYISLNSPDPAYVESVVINGKTYSIKKDVLSPERAEELKGKNVLFEYDKDKNVITGISKCREFSELNQDDINTINNERRINVKIDNEYKWSHGKVYVAGGTREVTSIPFKIVIGNTVPLNYSDLSDNCKNNNAFDYEVSSVKLKGIENCGNVSFLNNSFPKTVKLGKELVLDGTIVLPSDFWLGYEDSEKTISAEYEIKMKSGEKIKTVFETVVINRDQKTKVNDEKNQLEDAANQLKKVPTSAISLECLRNELDFTPKQVQYLEKVVMTEIALYTMPKKLLQEYVSDKIIKEIFKVNNPLTIQNGKMTIVLPKVQYQGRTIQVDIVCDIQDYSLYNCSFGNFSLISFHAYDLKKNGKREKVAFKDGTAGLNVYADVDAFTKAATDLALGEIKSATKKALSGYETVEQIIFGDTALKILNAAGYNSFFDFGWDLYVNECKKITLSCPVDVYVYDKDDNLCGSIVNGEVTLDTSDDVDLEVVNDEKIVTLWEDGYYTKTVSNCNGTLNIKVSEKGYINGDIRTLTFEDISLEIGTLLIQGYGNDYYDDQEAYAVETLNGEKIEATTDTLNMQHLDQITVSYNAAGGVAAESSKTVNEGEYVILPSATRTGYNLLGWSSPYDSTFVFDVGSSFKAISNTTLTAVWEKDQTINSSVKSVSISDITVGYRSSATLTPEITADEGADYKVTFTSSNSSAVSVDQNGRVTSNKTFGFTPASAVITCTVTDTNGNEATDTCTVTVQFTAIQWIIKIVLFGWIWY